MNIQQVYIENLKCGGCANTIIKELSLISTVKDVMVNVEKSQVSLVANEDTLTEVKLKLSKLGYPEVGDKNNVLHKAKSFVSCAVGRINS